MDGWRDLPFAHGANHPYLKTIGSFNLVLHRLSSFLRSFCLPSPQHRVVEPINLSSFSYHVLRLDDRQRLNEDREELPPPSSLSFLTK